MLTDDLSWQVLSADDYHEDFNDNSLVIRLSYGQTDFLFTGDLPITGEEHILQQDFILQSEVLKVGHHGSRYSSGQEFLQAISPQICVIQSGLDNKFGHPHPEVVFKMEQLGCQIKDTQKDGVVSLFSDGSFIY